MTPEEGKFLREHRFCVLSTVRGGGAPQTTPVYYLYEGGKLLISATRDRFKTINIQRDPRVAVCVLNEEHPFSYVQIMGRAEVTDEELVETSTRIYQVFTTIADDFPQRLRNQNRVVLMVTPEKVSSRIRAAR